MGERRANPAGTADGERGGGPWGCASDVGAEGVAPSGTGHALPRPMSDAVDAPLHARHAGPRDEPRPVVGGVLPLCPPRGLAHEQRHQRPHQLDGRRLAKAAADRILVLDRVLVVVVPRWWPTRARATKRRPQGWRSRGASPARPKIARAPAPSCPRSTPRRRLRPAPRAPPTRRPTPTAAQTVAACGGVWKAGDEPGSSARAWPESPLTKLREWGRKRKGVRLGTCGRCGAFGTCGLRACQARSRRASPGAGESGGCVCKGQRCERDGQGKRAPCALSVLRMIQQQAGLEVRCQPHPRLAERRAERRGVGDFVSVPLEDVPLAGLGLVRRVATRELEGGARHAVPLAVGRKPEQLCMRVGRVSVGHRRAGVAEGPSGGEERAAGEPREAARHLRGRRGGRGVEARTARWARGRTGGRGCMGHGGGARPFQH
eukprot:scaffold10378_cov111-Isochrysis_galbana.AAC.3